MALVLITHDRGVVAETAQRIMVMYAGQAVEMQTADRLFERPRHPYTAALLEALPERSTGRRRLTTIGGVVPGVDDRPSGCLFNPRCPYADERCRRERPALTGDREGRQVRCLKPLDGMPADSGELKAGT
jgi:dipeptide transport system ATP-binding protein